MRFNSGTMKIIFYNLFAVLVLQSLFSCSQLSKEENSKRKSAGKTAEIIVAITDKSNQGLRIRNEIDFLFGQEYQILPQSEPIFKVVHIPGSTLHKSDLFLIHHNILEVIIDEGYQSSGPEISFTKNIHASPQFICTISAGSDSAFTSLFNANKAKILDFFNQSERTRYQVLHKKVPNLAISKDLHKIFGIKLEVPTGFFIAKKAHSFIWIRKETQKTGTGIMVYTRAIDDTTAFNLRKIMSLRNSLTKIYIPGSIEGTFMVVADSLIQPVAKTTKIGPYPATEVRGLWEVEGDFMGGPFVNYTVIDDKNNRMICLDGYVYAPNAKKRDLMMQLDAIIHTLIIE